VNPGLDVRFSRLVIVKVVFLERSDSPHMALAGTAAV